MRYILNGIIQLLVMLLLEETSFFTFLFLVIGMQGASYFLRHRNSSWFLALIQVSSMYFILSFSLSTSIITTIVFLLTTIFDTPWKKWHVACSILLISIPIKLHFPNGRTLFVFGCVTLLTIIISSHTTKQAVSRISFLGFFSLLSIIPILLMSGIRHVLSYIVHWIALGVGYLLTPLLQIKLLSSVADKQLEIMKDSKSPDVENMQHVTPSPVLYNVTFILVTIGILIGIYLYRKFLQKRKSLINGSFSRSYNPISISQRTEQNKKQKAPKNIIRKEIFKLERKATQPFQRKKGETLLEWLTRLPNAKENPANIALIVQAYEEERYAEQQTAVPFPTFQNEIKKLPKKV